MENNNQKFIFYTGKGGVGKTTLACATAVKIADEGKKVLLISTDPASNLKDVLGASVESHITTHKKVPNLQMVNIDPEVSADEYRKRVITPLKSSVDEKELAKIEEGLSGACTTEIASFDEFARFITGEGESQGFDVVIFDTAPTGHTIRLLELPAAWDTFLEKNPQGASCIGPSSALKSSKERYSRVIQNLRNPDRTTFYLVSRTDKASLKEASKTSSELCELGFSNQKLSINGVFSALDQHDPLAVKIEKIVQLNLNNIPSNLLSLERFEYPLLPYNVLGVDKLRSFFDKQKQKEIIQQTKKMDDHNALSSKNISALVKDLEKSDGKGLVMTMGKGGVGKTIVAATVATLLAKKGHKVLLTTTDPAAHVTDFINQLDEVPETLTVERIDPKVETKIYTDKILEQKGKNLNEDERKLLIEDLKSPCNEEVAVFNAFSKAMHKAKRQYVIMDTAPTGHTLLLLDTTGAYHKEVMKTTSLDPSRITTPYMRLLDTLFAKIVRVALPDTTPMREAEELQNDLIRAGIEPYAWVINQSLSALENLSDPILLNRAQAELQIIDEIQNRIANDTFLLPYVADEKLLPAILELYV